MLVFALVPPVFIHWPLFFNFPWLVLGFFVSFGSVEAVSVLSTFLFLLSRILLLFLVLVPSVYFLSSLISTFRLTMTVSSMKNSAEPIWIRQLYSMWNVMTTQGIVDLAFLSCCSNFRASWKHAHYLPWQREHDLKIVRCLRCLYLRLCAENNHSHNSH